MSDSRTGPADAVPPPVVLDPDPAPSPPRRRADRRLLAVLGGLTALVLIADQVSKAWAQAALTPGDPVELLGTVLRLNLVHNPGAAFSLATGMTWVLSIIAAVVVAAVIHIARRLRSRGWAVALGLLLGGALGNLSDRLLRDPGFPQGHVVDFIDYSGFFVGNIADIAIVVAAGLIVILGIRGIGVDGTIGADRATGADRPTDRPADV